jgi:hypothetical protein
MPLVARMTTETAVMEQALVVMAVAMSLQTLLFMGAAIGAGVAWRKASRELALLRSHVDRISGTVDEVADSVRRATATVGDAVSDVRDALGVVRNSVETAVAVVAAPGAALAMALLRGVAVWRRHRATPRVEVLASHTATTGRI